MAKKKTIVKEVCRADKCKRKATVLKHHLCRTHYVRLLRTGTTEGGPIRKPKKIKPYYEV